MVVVSVKHLIEIDSLVCRIGQKPTYVKTLDLMTYKLLKWLGSSYGQMTFRASGLSNLGNQICSDMLAPEKMGAYFKSSVSPTAIRSISFLKKYLKSIFKSSRLINSTEQFVNSSRKSKMFPFCRDSYEE